MTLLFAENGRGKTTLCAILRSLQTGQHEFISERKTLGADAPAQVKIRLAGNTLFFTDNAWSATYPDIAIFDSVFIHDNVFAGDYVDHDHKKNLYRVIVGTQGVQLARQIEELDGKIREANREIAAKKEVASRFLPNGVTLDTYLAWQPVEEIENKIQKKIAEITSNQRVLEKSTEIQAKGKLSKIALPAFPSDFTTILVKQLTDITADAEARVRQQITHQSMGNHGEMWLSQGLNYVSNGKCPFCGQDLTANDLIEAYRSHFNAAYKSLKQEVAQLTQRITMAIAESTLNTPQQTLSNNLMLIEFWKQFAPVSLPDFSIDDVRNKYTTLRNIALTMAQKKQQTITESVEPEADFQSALDAVRALQQSCQIYNSQVDTCNSLITAQQEVVQKCGDINTLKKELADLESRKKRFEEEVVKTCQVYQSALHTKTLLERQKASAKKELDRYCEQILRDYEQAINTYLDQFGAGFRITNSRHSYTGGTPSSYYQIQINNTAIDLGDSRTGSGTPCFKTTLSSGDRSALALAFFLAALKNDSELANKIIVLDDPFTSLDRFRRTCTQQLISQFAGMAKQVLVLSHDPHFLKLVWSGSPPADIKVLQLCFSGDNTVIGEWDIETETQSTYMDNYSILLNFYRDRTGALLGVARAIRPFIEGMLRAHFPGHFQQNEWLGDFIEKIRKAAITSGLQHAQADLPEIEAINGYSKKYHHDQNPNADSESLSSDELHGFVKRTLRLVGGC
ncbi:MAG: AAA family ATPase [Nitrososphaerota archaeon]|nr:AAA family ATPase [Nitrososphaerota archaeon]